MMLHRAGLQEHPLAQALLRGHCTITAWGGVLCHSILHPDSRARAKGREVWESEFGRHGVGSESEGGG